MCASRTGNGVLAVGEGRVHKQEGLGIEQHVVGAGQHLLWMDGAGQEILLHAGGLALLV